MELDIEDSLYGRLERRAEEKGFDGPEEYSLFVLETVIEELEQNNPDEATKRLEDLGYM